MSAARIGLALSMMLALVAAPATAQGVRGGARGQARPQLERQLGERLAAVVQQRLGLDAPTMRRLQQTNQRFERERRRLLAQEREVRRGLRDELAAGDRANQDRVSDLMTRALGLERQRIDLLESEQRALAEFLTPVQRARYFAIEEQVRRQLQELRRRRLAGDSAGEAPRRLR